MKFNDVQLPSNSKFGFFFTAIFLFASLYLFSKDYDLIGLTLIAVSISFGLLTVIKDELLLPLNKLWMRFGFLLGSIVSPIILGIFFFLIFTPLGLILRLFGRDELRIKLSTRKSFWKIRNSQDSDNESFKQQF